MIKTNTLSKKESSFWSKVALATLTQAKSVSGAFDRGFLSTWSTQDPVDTRSIENTQKDMTFFRPHKDSIEIIDAAQITTCNNDDLEAPGISPKWINDGRGYWRASVDPATAGENHFGFYKHDNTSWSGVCEGLCNTLRESVITFGFDNGVFTMQEHGTDGHLNGEAILRDPVFGLNPPTEIGMEYAIDTITRRAETCEEVAFPAFDGVQFFVGVVGLASIYCATKRIFQALEDRKEAKQDKVEREATNAEAQQDNGQDQVVIAVAVEPLKPADALAAQPSAPSLADVKEEPQTATRPPATNPNARP